MGFSYEPCINRDKGGECGVQKSRAVIIVSITAVVTLLLLAGTVFAVFISQLTKDRQGKADFIWSS